MTSRLSMRFVAVCLNAGFMLAGSAETSSPSQSWNPRAAASYLDKRESWWTTWPGAARDHGTFCISCHTAMPYALARPALRSALGEEKATEDERKLLESVTTRVRLWNEVTPFYDEYYGPHKAVQSRGTESVLNVLILAAADARAGKMSETTRAAFDHLWATQEKSGDQKGAWSWLDFENEPFEASESGFYGASLAAVAVSMAPESYRATPEIQANLNLLRDYVGRECAREPLIHQLVPLWASVKWAGFLAPDLRKSIVDNVLAKQHSDGGWSLSTMSWTWRESSLRSIVNLWVRSNDTPLLAKSDGYATGLAVYVLGQAGVAFDDPHLQRGRTWLVRNQDQAEGMWPGYSLVNRRDPTSVTGRFMTDASTAFAVLALTAANGR
jgi:squalene-hopene/tetraprenyl-beta-curcumene cyclase